MEEKRLNSFIDKLVKAAIYQEEAMNANNYKLNNKYAKYINNLFMKIEKEEEFEKKVLTILLNHNEVSVRCIAACRAVKINYMFEEAIIELQDIAQKKENGMTRIEALMFLEYYNADNENSLKSLKTVELRNTNLINDLEGDNPMVISHIEKYLGKVDSIFHEIVSDEIPIDILHVMPTKERKYHTFVTSGMSNKPMKVPKQAENFRFAELMITLPPDWPVDEEDLKDENNYWPIRCLKQTARLPFEKNTWIGYGHTLQNGHSEKSYASNNNFSDILLTYPVSVESAVDFTRLIIDENKSIIFYSLIPLYKEEIRFKLKNGADALLEKFDNAAINDIVDLQRKNVCQNHVL